MSETPSRDPSRDNAMSVAAISSERIESDDNVWTRRLVFFLRIMAVVSVAKGLYHWAQVTGFVGGEEDDVAALAALAAIEMVNLLKQI